MRFNLQTDEWQMDEGRVTIQPEFLTEGLAEPIYMQAVEAAGEPRPPTGAGRSRGARRGETASPDRDARRTTAAGETDQGTKHVGARGRLSRAAPRCAAGRAG